jgi:hypothetical protein
MTYDLIAWPVDRALTTEEAARAVEALRPSMGFRLRTDKRISRFVQELGKRYPDGRFGARPFELDVHGSHVFVGIGWSMVAEVTATVGDCAWAAGLALWDPQRRVVAMPAPLADLPMTWEGIESHIEAAEGFMSTLGASVERSGTSDPVEVLQAVNQDLRAAGYRMASPMGFEVTPELEAEVMADPTRMPSGLQVPERKADLLRKVVGGDAGDRHLAVAQLSGWDPDPEVAEALRGLLASDDVFLATTAANGLVRQGDRAALDAVLELVRTMSPADGGSAITMLGPVSAALDLAALVGPEATDRVRARAREWLGPDRTRSGSTDREARIEIERQLAATPGADHAPGASDAGTADADARTADARTADAATGSALGDAGSAPADPADPAAGAGPA